MTKIIAENVQELMPIYYQRLFPFEQFIQFLSFGSQELPLHLREFSFTIRAGDTLEEVYIRYLSFSSTAEFRLAILDKLPEKIDIGAVYSGKPKMKQQLRLFKPMQRELVFDIDMTDYDDVRTCCSGASVCNLCWKFMTVAIKILNIALTECFGFAHLLFVFSGRRGIHVWISDQRALSLSEEVRKSIVSFLELIKGGDQKAKKVYLSSNNGGLSHVFVEKALGVVTRWFEEIVLRDQDLLMDKDKEAKMLEIIPSEIRGDIAKIWSAKNSSLSKWKLFLAYLDRVGKYQNLEKEIMIQYTYPRLDAQVSMHLNHLLKAPFCVHPKTGKVCIPIDPSRCEQFSPLTVPTVSTLIDEINATCQDGAVAELDDWKKTGMKEGMMVFEGFLSALDADRRQKGMDKRDNEDMKLLF